MQKIRKLVIPVAGMGTRFLPITKCVPKEMLPIVDIPTIQILLEEAVNAGIEEVILVTNDKKECILKHFEKDNQLEEKLLNANKLELLEKVRNINKNLRILSVKQLESLGSGHAIYQAKQLIGNEPFAVMYGDDIIKGGCALKELIDVYELHDSNVIGVQEVAHELTYKYGIVSLEDEKTLKINGLVEKPKVEDAPSDLAGLGRYILKPEIFDILEDLSTGAGGEYQLTDAMSIFMKKSPFYACRFKGTYYDIGSQLGYVKANIMYALDREDIKNGLIRFMQEIIQINFK